MRKSIDNVNNVDSEPVGRADAVFDLIHTVMHRFRSLQYQALRDGLHDVTHMESKVLGFFARHPQATLSDLAQHSGRDKAQLTRLIKGLRERGLLSGEPDPADRRNVHLRLSGEGAAVQRALHGAGRHLGTRAIEGLDDAEQVQLVELLTRLEANLDGQE